jgi:hypothetical protein
MRRSSSTPVVGAVRERSPRDVEPRTEILGRLQAMALGHAAMVTSGAGLSASVEARGTFVVQLRSVAQRQRPTQERSTTKGASPERAHRDAPHVPHP